jgi:hydroxypyruvate isomerase
MNTQTHASESSTRTASLLTRRNALKHIGGGALAFGAAIGLPRAGQPKPEEEFYKIKNNRIQQSVVHWCYQPMPVDELAAHAARMGLESVELVAPEHWPALKKLGLICAIAPSHGFAKGFAHKEEHDECLETLRKNIDETAAAGFPNIITFSGFRRGMSDEEGIKNMVEGLKKVVGRAEKRKVNLCLEMLNSRVNIEMKGHPDYFCDKIEIAVEVCKRISSERMKILFDIHHVQIMQGDLIARIKEFRPYIGHYHTAGVPGRNEINDAQEINYAAVMKTIVETGYKGYVGQEFIPTRDKVKSLNEAVRICDV